MNAQSTGKRSRSVISCVGRTNRPTQGSRALAGFTLVELLVVIGIIVILMGILVPTIGYVRRAAYSAKTQQMISQLSAAVESYHMDYRAYPGPVLNDYIGRANTSGVRDVNGNAIDATNGIAMSENLFLGLSGGLQLNTATGVIFFAPADVAKGPRVLTPTGTKTNAFAHSNYVQDMPFTKPSGLNAWRFADGIGMANDTIIPEYVDGYSVPLPILYLRARSGARTATPLVDQERRDNAVITQLGNPRGQYELEQILGYTDSDIGEGKDTSKKKLYTAGNWPQHGLRSIDQDLQVSMLKNQADGLGYVYPYDAYAYFGNPASYVGPPDRKFSQPRQKDGYILISAGSDRIYGTEDDICSFGSLFQSGQ